MKKIVYVMIVAVMMCAVLLGCSTKTENNTPDVNTPVANTPTPEANVPETNPSENVVTQEMAYEGVNNYCHSEYDWSIAEENPSIMYVEMGEETESEYHVIFRSYTGSFVNFYVDKSTGITRMVDYVPGLDIESEAGTIDIHEYLNK